MVDCRPFRGWRYHLNGTTAAAAVVAPPYDVISPTDEAVLRHAHTHNIIHLTRSPSLPTDTDTTNAYTRARDLLHTWCANGVLAQDDPPAFYIYEQSVTFKGIERRRLGFINLTRLVEPNAGELFFHEHTFPAPREDRLRLLQTVQAHLSPVFTMFSEPAGGPVMSLLRGYIDGREPELVVPIRDETHRVWRMDHPVSTNALQTAMRDQTLMVADGHHRYEAAWLNRAHHPWVLNFCSWLEDPGLVVLPIHRVIEPRPAGLDATTVRDRLDRCGAVMRAAQYVEMVQQLTADTTTPGVFGHYADGVASLVRMDPALCAELEQQLGLLGQLDVVRLHEGLFPRTYGASAAAQLKLRYTPASDDALRAAQASGRTDAWLLRPISPSTVGHLARQCVRLPQKSTYFFPKLLTGLVLHRYGMPDND